MQASWIIESNTKAHSSAGYVSWHMVAAAHEKSIRDLCAQLDVLKGRGLQAARGCYISTQTFGAASVEVEYEGEPASGDGWNEPRQKASVDVLRVFLNGVWCDVQDTVPDATIERWEQAILDASEEVEA